MIGALLGHTQPATTSSRPRPVAWDDTRLDTPPSIDRRHPDSGLAHNFGGRSHSIGAEIFRASDVLPFLLRAGLTVFRLPERLVPEGTAPLLGRKLGNIGTIARKHR